MQEFELGCGGVPAKHSALQRDSSAIRLSSPTNWGMHPQHLYYFCCEHQPSSSVFPTTFALRAVLRQRGKCGAGRRVLGKNIPGERSPVPSTVRPLVCFPAALASSFETVDARSVTLHRGYSACPTGCDLAHARKGTDAG